MILVSTNVPEAMPSLKAWRKESVAAIRSRIRIICRPEFYIVHDERACWYPQTGIVGRSLGGPVYMKEHQVLSDIVHTRCLRSSVIGSSRSSTQPSPASGSLQSLCSSSHISSRLDWIRTLWSTQFTDSPTSHGLWRCLDKTSPLFVLPCLLSSSHS